MKRGLTEDRRLSIFFVRTISEEAFSTIAVKTENLITGREIITDEMPDYRSSYFFPMIAAPARERGAIV